MHKSEHLYSASLLDITDTCDSEVLSDKTPIPPPDWEALISQIADEIIAEHTPARILQVRAKLYDLLTHCIPATTILKVLASRESPRQQTDQYLQTLTWKLIPKIDDSLKAEVVKWSAFYEHRIRLGTVSLGTLPLFTNADDCALESDIPPRSVRGKVHAYC